MSENAPLSKSRVAQILFSNMLVNTSVALYPIIESRNYGRGTKVTPYELVESLKVASMKGIENLSESLGVERDTGSQLFENLFSKGYEFPNKNAMTLIKSVVDSSNRAIPLMTSDPTLEGEGPEIGTPTLLTRLGGCAVRCKGCDTPHSWNADIIKFDGVVDAGRREYNATLDVSDIADLMVQQCGYYGLKRVSITGGEPLHYVDALRLLVADLWLRGFYINLETSGTLFDPVIFAMCHVSVDIKTPSSRVDLSPYQIGALKAVSSYEHGCPAHLKAVISDKVDIEFIASNFGDILKGNGIYRPLCLTPWAHAVQEDLDVPRMSSNVDSITNWVFTNKDRVDARQVRVIGQQHKLLGFT